MSMFEGKGKTEPNADLRMVAQTAWQIYVALKDAGFSRADAMTLVSDILSAGVSQAATDSQEGA